MKAQDILIALKIQSLQDQAVDVAQRRLAEDTGVSLSEVSAACRRLANVGLLSLEGRRIVGAALLEFLVHSLKYVFPMETGGISRGMPTGYAADPLRDQFLSSKDELVPVWPDPEGTVRGMAVQPLYRSVPMAAKKDKKLYEYPDANPDIVSGWLSYRARAT